MDWVGLAINMVGLVWAYFGYKQNEELKRLIVTEKNMIRDRILDYETDFEVAPGSDSRR